ncbi:hypothetical protein SAMN05216480_101639 [Pustulibacterium marinum]|uniref:Glycosyltransferase 2-like domain-containing protein n=1 Tax=Pustulibacterium marinum TaxID=1224947 RepID=A0A1I7F569_9FLAO|nr:glycosyltransferase family A protein [Pustulibacterium marinum]SFU31265.1 hypothetical protein SAMN05216480_101639 [Pustulibacterium marinum]
MSILIIIPAHNEEASISYCLDSLVRQTLKPTRLVLVDDSSTDTTLSILKTYEKQFDFIQVIQKEGESEHIPGAKVIDTFYRGLSEVSIADFDIICKFDADIIFPEDYLEKLSQSYKNNPNLGMCSGLCFIKAQDNKWIYENIAHKDHVRGPIKSYSKLCFEKIGGLKKSIGWDTVDELLAKFHGFDVETIKDLHVKHLRPTGKIYTSKAKLLQGIAMYKMRYKLPLTCIASAKMALQQKKKTVFINNLKGYFTSKKEKTPFMVTPQEGAFIRKYRYKGILKKLLGK